MRESMAELMPVDVADPGLVARRWSIWAMPLGVIGPFAPIHSSIRSHRLTRR
jgi:hypothetical protein